MTARDSWGDTEQEVQRRLTEPAEKGIRVVDGNDHPST